MNEENPNSDFVPDQALQLTEREELAVIVERLRKHLKCAMKTEAHVRLEVAKDLIQAAIHYR